ncbi:MAG: geranylgeranyl reductase family protein [Flavobacteriales bacterium]|nr:geranylgeranyl reductase family protein [Flavobacteriales bacterium]
MAEVYDVVISGGGPAGTSAAIGLKNSGLKVLLLEKHVFPRDKICGDALSPDVWRQLLQLQVPIDEIRSFTEKIPSYGARVSSPSGDLVEFEFPDMEEDLAPGYISERFRFDHYMWKMAADSNVVDARDGVTVKGAHWNGKRWKVETSRGAFESRMLFIADGAQSILAKQMGQLVVEREHYCAGLRQYWHGVQGFHEKGFIELHFEKEIIPGYFWMFPLPNGNANVGIGMLSSKIAEKKVDLKKHMHRLIHEHPDFAPRFKDAEPLEKVKGWGLPIGSKKRVISGDHFVLLGDAASVIDPATGEGIGNSIRTGRVAAAVVPELLKARKTSAKDLKAYDEEVYRRMWSELKWSRALQNMLKYPGIINYTVRKSNRNETVRKIISGSLTEIELRKNIYNPLFYLKLLLN